MALRRERVPLDLRAARLASCGPRDGATQYAPSDVLPAIIYHWLLDTISRSAGSGRCSQSCVVMRKGGFARGTPGANTRPDTSHDQSTIQTESSHP